MDTRRIFPQGQSDVQVKLTTHLSLERRLRTHGALPPFTLGVVLKHENFECHNKQTKTKNGVFWKVHKKNYK
jgi:hypothetical protein